MAEWLTPDEVADELRVTRRAVYRWLQSGRLQAAKAGRVWRIRRKDLEEFLGLEEELSPDDLEAVQRGLEDVRAGRVKTIEQYEAERGLEPAR